MRIVLANVSGRLSSDGSRLISALLKRAGHKVTTVFMARAEPLKYSTRELEQLEDLLSNADLAMVAVYSSYAVRAVQVTTFIKRKFPGMKVIWGGPHCISVPELCLRYADGVCFSEGDEAVVDLVDSMELGRQFERTPNMAFRINGTTVINPALGPFTNLNSLPYYDYEFDDHYLLDGELNPMNKQILRKRLSSYPVNKPILVSVTSRGCPQTCSYCNNCRYVKLFGHNIIRLQSPRRVIEEIEFILKRLDFIDFIGFGDDDFFVRPLQEIQEFCEIYKSRIGLPFGVAVSANTFSRKKMQFLFEAGLKVLQLGVQSGSQRLLDEVYSRKVKLPKTESVIKLVSEQYEKRGLNLITDFIIDNPYETKNDIYQSLQFISKMPISVKINLFSLAFFPGTPIYDRALKDGIVDLTLQTSSRFYSSKGIRLRYQLNYETFLILLAKQLRSKFEDHGKIVELILKILGTRAMRKIGALMPKQFYQYSVRFVA